MSRGAPGQDASALHPWLQRAAQWVVRRHRVVLAAWAVAIAVAAPLAARLPSVLAEQGASKIVPGTQAAAADRLLRSAFRGSSERDVLVVVDAPDVRAPGIRRLLARLDLGIARRRATGDVAATSSPLTVFRDATLAYADARRRPTRGAGAPPPASAMSPELARLLRRVVAARDPNVRRGLATAFALRSDWRRFVLPLPRGALRRVIAPDGRLALVSIRLGVNAGPSPDLTWLRRLAAPSARELGPGRDVRTHVTGDLALIHDTYQKAEADNGVMETVALVIVALVLLVFFRAIAPAVITVAAIGLSMNVSKAALFALGHEVHLTQFTLTIMTFVMLGAGVDYSMLLSSRYRQERVAGRSVQDAVVHATAHAGHGMIVAGACVVLAFAATLVSPVEWIPPLGFGGLVGIPIILLAALTLTPSLLALLGDRFFWLGSSPLDDLERRGAWATQMRRAARLASRRRVAITVTFALLTVPFGWLAVDHRSTSDPVALSPQTDSRQGAELIGRAWGKGALFPTTLVGHLDRRLLAGGRLTSDGIRGVERLARRVGALDGVADVSTVTRPLGVALTPRERRTMPPELQRGYLSEEGVLRVEVRLRDDPFSKRSVRTVRRVHDIAGTERIGPLLLGGATRVDEDYAAALRTSLVRMVVLVSIGIFIVLAAALRSLLVPVRLIATIGLSNLWAVGLTVIVFAAIRDQPIIDDLPIFLVILMMGLGIDYEIFLVARVRELRVRGLDDARAITGALVDTGRVITAAGLVMAGSLGAMMLSSTLMLQEYGFGLGFAVLLDATLVRLLLVPATLLLTQRCNWWMPRLPLPSRHAVAEGKGS